MHTVFYIYYIYTLCYIYYVYTLCYIYYIPSIIVIYKVFLQSYKVNLLKHSYNYKACKFSTEIR